MHMLPNLINTIDNQMTTFMLSGERQLIRITLSAN